MATGNMGQYSVSVIADFSQFNQGVLSAVQMLSQQTQSMVNMFSAMNSNASKSMAQMAASITASVGQTTASLNSLQSAMNNINTAGVANSTGNLTQQHGNLQNALRASTQSTNMLCGAFSMLRSHLEYMATGALIAGLIGIPALMIKTAAETETLTQKMRQNLELADQYHNNTQKLDGDLKQLNDNAGKFAVGFGVGLPEVMESMQILSRRFKDVESISYLTSVALTMNKLDFVDLGSATKNLEAVMLQFNLSTQGTKQFLNDFSVACHVANIKGSDLMDALQRSGSAFKGFNMGSREAIAAVSALSTETARTGSTIGNTMKSITANFSMDKAITALESYNIKLYDVSANGMKTMRDGANVFAELQNLYAKLDDEGKSKLALAIAGGKYQVNAMQAFLADANGNFSKIMNELKTKSSDEMTQELLKTGMETFTTKLGQTKAAFQVFAQTMGNQVLPYLKDFTVGLSAGIMWMKNHSDAVMSVCKGLGELFLAYTAIKVASFAYYTAVGLTAIATSALTGSMALATAGTWAQNAANVAATISAVAATFATSGLAAGFTALWFAVGPVGWALLAITALGVAIYEIYTNWAPILQWLKDAWNGVIEYISNHIYLFIPVFGLLGVAIVVIREYWEPVITFLKKQWADFVTFIQGMVAPFIAAFNGMCAAFPLLVEATGRGISNMMSILGSLVRSILPAWGNDVIDFFVNLGNKLVGITAQIGAMIRKNLTIGGLNAGGGVGDTPYGPQNKEKSLFEKAMDEQRAMYEQMVNSNRLPGGGGESEPTIGNQIPGKKDKKDKKGPKEESPYSEAKREYQEEIADQELAASDKIAIYKRYLAEVQKNAKEETNYKVGLGHLELQARKDDLEMAKALLDQQITQNKVKTTEAYNQNIVLLQKEAESTKTFYGEKSKQYVEAMTKMYAEENKLRDFKIALEKEELDRNRQHATALLDITAQQNQYLRDNGMITEHELNKLVEVNEATRYKIKKDALDQALLNAKDDEKAQAKIKTDLLALEDQYQAKKLQLEQKTYQESHKYQFAAFNGIQSGLDKVLQGFLHWNMSIKNMFHTLSSSMLNEMGNIWVKGMIQKWSVGLAKMLGLEKAKDAETVVSKVTTDATVLASTATTEAATSGIVVAAEGTKVAATVAAGAAAKASGTAALDAMLPILAIMALVGAFMGGSSGSSTTTDGPGVNLGRSPDSYYKTPLGVPSFDVGSLVPSSLSVPSFDVGSLNVPHDMLAQIHKGEVIVPTAFADNARDFISNGGFSSNSNTGGDMHVNMNYSAAHYGRTNKDVQDEMKANSKHMVSLLHKEWRSFNRPK